MYSRAPRRSWHTYTYAHTQAITVVALRGAFNPNSFLGLLLPSEREQLSTAPSLLLAHFEPHSAVTIHISHTHTLDGHTCSRTIAPTHSGSSYSFPVFWWCLNTIMLQCVRVSSALYWPVVIKILHVPLGRRGQFVSSALIWQHFNPTGDKLGNSFIWHVKKKIKNRLSEIKKLTCDPCSRTAKEWESSSEPEFFIQSQSGSYRLEVHYMRVLIWLLLFVSSVNSVARLPMVDWTRKGRRKRIHIYVCFMFLLQRSVWKPLLLWRRSLNFCVFVFFRQSESTIFPRADAGLWHFFCSG